MHQNDPVPDWPAMAARGAKKAGNGLKMTISEFDGLNLGVKRLLIVLVTVMVVCWLGYWGYHIWDSWLVWQADRAVAILDRSVANDLPDNDSAIGHAGASEWFAARSRSAFQQNMLVGVGLPIAISVGWWVYRGFKPKVREQ